MTSERVTVTLPEEIVRDIDHREKNRSKFILQAVQNELDRRKRDELQKSLQNPHPESLEMAEMGMNEWVGQSAAEDEDLLDPNSGRRVRWNPGKGWIEVDP
jgi:Arc/MetJ-type ribon-helix-helix transcriptional regulator